ncbi:ABC transporter ATP-binding protein [Saprospiraceae bacterium]|mgnify:FL=1|jgi:lipoprotein-releasing system ATP-binding protein|nr:ABC transporter ATP-binding protein [bacterium]MDA9873274.1 ABC transporter ATP-binding protein [Saprospiraceae bacterium]MDC1508663.1 ABC transporter ATP-binding protein [Saprospiraceae bacterium]HAV28962.1 lipoprotein-releasing system ATP-binding protein LolD [Saprospirales bacterium]|tara:strand:+ start:3056 stop:3709 length:654 start_codon:yes stop_codon:yes gene_type:complete
MIQGKDIIKSYEDLQVLKGVDIDITKGEIVSIIGKSGAGKSTLLHIVGTLDHSDAGTIVINGVDTTRLNKKNLAKFRNETIGFVFQFHHLLNEFTALENVTIPAHIQGTNATEAEKKAKELLDYLGLGDRMEHKPQELSGGEQQRVAVARALINDPAVIFADEPTGNLDASSSDDLHNLFKKLQSEMGQTFLIVTHNQELAKLSDRTLTMQDGRIIS